MPSLSLFSGAMGLDLGLEQAGIKTTLAIDDDTLCCRTMRTNRPDHHDWEADISQLTSQDILDRLSRPKELFLMVGGPPCQSFSSGGKRAALADPRGNLIYVYLRLIDQIRPRYFILENVANIITAALHHRPIADRPGKRWNLSSYQDKAVPSGDDAPPMKAEELSGSAIRQIVDDVRELGYDFTISVVDSCDYGAAQKRLRFIMLGSRDGRAPTMPPPTHGDRSSSQTPEHCVRDAIYDLRDNPGPHSEYTPSVARFFALVPPGGNWRDLPKDLQREALGDASLAAGGGKTGFYRRLAWDAPSPTITGRANRKGSALCHPEAIRPLSVRECARLQGFPDDWVFQGSMNRQYLQVGNAVPVPLGAAIGRALLETAGEKPTLGAFDLDRALLISIKRLRAAARNKRSKKDEQPTLFD
jgi:DNA (cytosine-5)-methyltransferase 1